MRSWARQPQLPVGVDRSNPLAAGLVDVGVLSRGPRTLMRRSLPTLGGTMPIFTALNGAVGLNQLSNESLTWGTSAPDNWHRFDGPFSWMTVMYQGGTTANGRRLVSNLNVVGGFALQSNASNYEFRVGDGSTIITCVGNVATVGKHVILGVFDGTNLNLYVDGVLRGQQACSASNGSTATSLTMGGQGLAFHHQLWAMWSRPLGAGEAFALSQDPYQLLRPVRPGVRASTSTPTSVACALGVGVATGKTATVAAKTNVAAALGVGAGLGRSASIALQTHVAAAVGAAVGSGRTAAVSMHTTIPAAVGHATAVGSSATVTLGTHIAAQAGVAVGQGRQAVVALHTNVSAAAGAAVSNGLGASVQIRGSIACGVGIVTAAGSLASISATMKIEAQTGIAVASGAAAVVALRTGVAGHVANATADGLQAGIVLTTHIHTGVGVASGVGSAAGVMLQTSVAGNVGAATAQGRQADIGSGSSGASPAQVWAYELSDGVSAGVMLQAVYAAVASPIEGTFTMADLLRIMAAIAAGKSSIATLGAGAARVEFRAVDDSAVRVVGEMAGSERAGVTLTP